MPQCRPNRKLPEVGTCHKRSLFLFDDRTLHLTQAHRRQDQAGRLFVHLFIPSRRLERLLLQRWSSRRIGHLFRVVETGTVACMRRHGLEKSDPSIVAMEVGDKTEHPLRSRWSEERDQGECEPATHAPDSESEQRVTGAGTHTEKCRTLCRHTPEVGAVCGKAARTVLCGGRSAMSVPTASLAPCCTA